MSEVKVNKISPRSGTDVTLGDSGDTFTVPTGVTLDTSNSTVTLPDGSVTNAKIADSTIQLAKLSATGTKDATTFLRGDNTFAEAGGGKVLQVVSATHSTEATSSSSTYADTGLTASITPASTSNKILVIVNQNGLEKDNTDTKVSVKLLRDTTDIALFCSGAINTSSAVKTDVGGTGSSILDTPNTTSSTTYKTQFKNDDASGVVSVQSGSSVSSITLLEISE